MSSNDAQQGEASSSARPDEERRRLRNRLSQRAFRQRQAERVRAGRQLAGAQEQSENDRVAQLQGENHDLRMALVEMRSRLARLAIALQRVDDNAARALGQPSVSSESQVTSADTEVRESPTAQGGLDPSVDRDASFGTADTLVPTLRDLELQGATGQGASHPESSVFSDISTPWAAVARSLSSPLPLGSGALVQLPNIWNYDDQRGLQPYASASNSPFSDHIDVIHRLLKAELHSRGITTDPSVNRLYLAVLLALSIFNSVNGPDVMAWYASTRFFHIIELTAWQLRPCRETFLGLNERYHPTRLQNEQVYPAVINWVAFPSVRDGLIRFHATNPRIDEIFRDAVSSYVVEASLSDLLVTHLQVTVYVRVTDLFSYALGSDELDGPAEPSILPAPDVATLFSSPSYARAAFHRLRMSQGVSAYKMDPAFFRTYPELLDQTSDIIAQGVPLKPEMQTTLTLPQPLDKSILQTYRGYLKFLLDATSLYSSFADSVGET